MTLKGILNQFTQSGGNQRAVFTSGLRQYVTTVQAMKRHASQLVWFRYLYVAFSRYMWVNEWVEVNPTDILQRNV